MKKETEVKRDSEWMKEEFKKLERAGVIDSWVYRDLWMMANQLDEPEVLSQKWIEEHRKSYTMEDSVEISDLKNLIIPKQDLPVIPKYVAEYLEFAKKEASLIQVMVIISEGWPTMKKEFDWISENDEIFARAWLDGYEVEKEPLYRARLKVITDEFIASYLRTQSSDAEDRLKALEIGSKYIHEDYRHLSEFTEDELKRLDIWDSEQWEVEELEE